ncbi:MAG: penicillin-binding transpeptidase domain-containing protein, partial [Patescibacteria group bacterium]
LSISGELQKTMYDAIGRVVEDRGFTGGSGVALDAHTGEVIGMVSYPGFDLNVVSTGFPSEQVSLLFSDPRKPLFFRALAGLYPPASTVKPFLAAAALQERIIRPEKIVYTDGRLVIPNPYNPDNPSIFRDWKNHGPVDMRDAIAVSSDVYFYTIGGGHGNQEGLGRERIARYLSSFGMGQVTGIDLTGEKTGNMPNDVWKAERYPDDPVWRIGDTYNISIGQGGMTVTPLQMARATLAIANGGILKNIQIVRDAMNAAEHEKSLPFESGSLQIAREGMRRAVLQGTAIGVSDISLPVAAKTGTAEVGKTGRVHSWFIGFLPWEDPELVLVINLEDGSALNLVGATAAAHEILHWYTTGGREMVFN